MQILKAQVNSFISVCGLSGLKETDKTAVASSSKEGC